MWSRGTFGNRRRGLILTLRLDFYPSRDVVHGKDSSLIRSIGHEHIFSIWWTFTNLIKVALKLANLAAVLLALRPKELRQWRTVYSKAYGHGCRMNIFIIFHSALDKFDVIRIALRTSNVATTQLLLGQWPLHSLLSHCLQYDYV